MKTQTEEIYSRTQLEKAAKIKLLLMDVDGVLTDGKLYYFPDSSGKMTEFKGFSSQDGVGIHLLRNMGIDTGVISGRVSPAVEERAQMLKMRYVYQGHLKKIACWDEILKDSGFSPEETAFIGDDIPDIPLMRKAGLAVAVANARAEVLAEADFICPNPGGNGAVRDAAELILKARGKWQDALNEYLNQ